MPSWCSPSCSNWLPPGWRRPSWTAGWSSTRSTGRPASCPSYPTCAPPPGGALVEISTSEIPDDWSERWKAFHRPVLLEAVPGAPDVALHVRPPWEGPSERPGVQEIVIDPGQAFGTGAHATTRLCLELLLELAAALPERGPLLDIGTGSGVLAIAGSRLRFAPVLGLDHERESVQATRENAAVNAVNLEARHWDLRSEELPWIGRGSPIRPSSSPTCCAPCCWSWPPA